MSLPAKAVERIFLRLGAVYGTEFTNRYAAIPDANLAATWAHELRHFCDRLYAIAWALEHLPPRCPNLIEFRDLCDNAPAPVRMSLPEPRVPADPAKVAALRAKLAEMLAEQATRQRHDGRAWARHIVARHEAGEHVTPRSLRLAREALLRPHVAQGAHA